MVKKIAFSERSKGKIQLVVSYQVETDPCCGLNVIFCGFISHLIGRETINIPEIFSGVHGFPGKTVRYLFVCLFVCLLSVVTFTVPCNNMQTLKFKTQLKILLK